MKSFPCKMPKELPVDRPVSAATKRLYEMWNPHEDRENDLYSNFKYSRTAGLDKEEGITRRDPSKVLKIDGTYYVWYTKRMTESMPVGIEACDDKLPATDWDLSDIWYATSKDGFNWTEQGVAVKRGEKGEYANRAVLTPDVMYENGKYYLYFQALTTEDDKYNNLFEVSYAVADSPHGPWKSCGYSIIKRGADDEWDSNNIDDPYIVKFQGKYWIYYKSAPIIKGEEMMIRAQGVAVSDHPEGPYVKSDMNPIINSGHETCFFPFKDGIASIVSIDGPEKNTIQYAEDGLNFEIASIIQIPPVAPGAFSPDAFDDDGDGQGIRWGLCHVNPNGGGADQGCFIARFDCALYQGSRQHPYKHNNIRYGEDTFFQRTMALDDESKERIIANGSDIDVNMS